MMQTVKDNLADLARDILADKWDRLPEGDYTTSTSAQWKATAEIYLDNLEHGLDHPHDLLALIGEAMAAVKFDDLAFWRERRGEPVGEFGDWFDADEYRARAAESYVPAGGVV